MTDTEKPPSGNPPTSLEAGRLGPKTKVFGIGLNKTGTSSLKRSWIQLGIGPIPSPEDTAKSSIVRSILADNDYEPALEFAENYRGMEDRPWNVWKMYRKLHERFEDSLFILTVRGEESWWRSVHRWITVSKPALLRTYLRHFGASELSKPEFIRAYRRHNAEARAYFEANAPDRLLVLEIGSGEEWEKICNFFGTPIPPVPFPHVNEQRYLGEHEQSSRLDDDGLHLNRCSECNLLLLVKRKSNPSHDAGRSTGRIAKWRHGARIRGLVRRAGRPIGEELKTDHPNLTLDGLGVVTCFFNPSHSKQRLINYHRFAEGVRRAGVTLQTVELALDNEPHQIKSSKGDVLRVRSRSVMWHKERMLNLGIESLIERGYDRIAWLDADIEFLSDGWPWHIAAALESFNVCQVFGHVLVQRELDGAPLLSMGAVKYFDDHESFFPKARTPKRHRLQTESPSGASGFGWAARADVLKKVPLYDAAIIGGGDKLILFASYAHEQKAKHAISHWFKSANPTCPRCGHRNVSDRWQGHYLEWANRWNEAMEGKVGFAETLIRDFYHGSLESRQYQFRTEVLLRQDFDPERDLRLNSDACYEWGSEKPQMHQDLRRYFNRRTDH